MPKTLRDEDLVRVDDHVYAVAGSNTNWVIVKDGDSCTLIDTGYPGDHDALLASLAAVGLGPEAVAAVLVTHAHNDHIGAAERLRVGHGVPVLMHEEEVPHARRDFLDQVTLGQVFARAWRPGVAAWAKHALAAGGKVPVPVLEPQAFPAPGALDLPGAPVPVHTPGHTRGHCAYLLPGSGILISGDSLVTGHPTTRVTGPQLLPAMFHHDRPAAERALAVLGELDADVLVPGHGPVHRGSVCEAAALARERAQRLW
ncbi:MBL fold metallo-hydrolase [Kitasatospora viridis]|uniref:Glyoxylase-like metal-dependent hydrolase (Beta-lactamase superfamily II) n=1 Tax=Kitasatospora viridis TaxID=281105 RepID=A0A561SEN4_9ACTN|nr:MBL fold metallo-hydrolase [Kitasatospora viridis]TWF73318.1 glyoxylase-like metal-dependent hydrolase (beta-lactamase superfamily II) [Kitasatospora viridis]